MAEYSHIAIMGKEYLARYESTLAGRGIQSFQELRLQSIVK